MRKQLLTISLLLSFLVSFGQGQSAMLMRHATTVVNPVYKTTLTIDHTKCGSTNSSNFTVLVSYTDARFKSVANGGKVYRSDGNDIEFYSNASDTTTLMSWQLQSYDPVNGVILAWVRVGTIDHSADVSFYMRYGMTWITTFQGGAASSVWNSNFLSVWPLNDNAASTTVVDQKGNANGVMTANTSTKTATGQIGTGLSFSGSDHVRLTSVYSGFSGKTNTYSAWLKISAYSTFGVVTLSTTTGATVYHQIESNTVVDVNTANFTITSTTMNGNTWVYVSVTNDGTTTTFYVNGVSKGTGASGTAFASGAKNFDLLDWIGGESGNYAMKGVANMLTFSSVANSVDWILTEYNNQNAPTTFITLSAQTQ